RARRAGIGQHRLRGARAQRRRVEARARRHRGGRRRPDRASGTQSAEPRRDTTGAAAEERLAMPDKTPALEKHRDALEVHETMMGQGRGRLAVAMDLLTDALAMIGQHSVYCQSTRMP